MCRLFYITYHVTNTPFKAHFKPKRLGLFHENDVATMCNELIRDCHQVTLNNEVRFITLRQIMQKKLGPPEIKAEFIHAVRTRTIRPVGIMGDRPGGLVFEAAIVKDYLKNLQKQTQDVRSFHEVPATLGIHPNTIASLIQRGHLSYRYVQLGFFVEEKSVLDFNRRYIACSTLAKMKGVPHSQIMLMLQELNLRPLQIHGKGRAGQRTFIDRRLLPLFGIGHEGLRGGRMRMRLK